MNQRALILGGVFGFGVYLVWQQTRGNTIDLAAPKTDSLADSAAQIVDKITMSIFSINNMTRAKPEMLAIPNVRAMLAVIRKGEGTSDSNGYRRIFGGQLFVGFADHPRVVVRKGGYVSTAAGAYQFLASTWDETRRIMKLADFSPANQDLAALGRIAARGALDDVIAGRFHAAINKLGKEWASLPGSPYGQPVQTLQGAQQVYIANNGSIARA
jgi:muramidase (phage lysozyme)